MKYDISKQSAPQMPTLEKRQFHAFFLSKRPSKRSRNPRFDAFPLSWSAEVLSGKLASWALAEDVSA